MVTVLGDVNRRRKFYCSVAFCQKNPTCPCTGITLTEKRANLAALGYLESVQHEKLHFLLTWQQIYQLRNLVTFSEWPFLISLYVAFKALHSTLYSLVLIT
jgi:hypothetical protein